MKEPQIAMEASGQSNTTRLTGFYVNEDEEKVEVSLKITGLDASNNGKIGPDSSGKVLKKKT